MTDAEIGLFFKKDLARLIEIYVIPHASPEKIKAFMELKKQIDDIPDEHVGSISKTLKRQDILKGLI